MSKTEWKYLFLITVIFVASCVETDIYLPAFPDMMGFFSVSEEAIQRLLTWNFFGMCIAGPLYGPISDAFGRRLPLISSLALFLLGSLMTVFAQDFDQMIWGRLLQGLGSGGCFTLGTAIIFDAFQADKAIRATNQLNLIIPFIMAAAPMAGGYLNSVFGFRSNFLVIAVLVSISFLISLFFFDETLPKEKRVAFEVRKILLDFKKAFTCIPLLLVVIVLSLLFSGYMTFLSGSAVLFVIEMGVSKQAFPYYQASILVAWIVGGLFLNRAISAFGYRRVKQIGTALLIIGGIGFAFAAWLDPQNPLLLTSFMLLHIFGANWANGIYFPESMELLPEIKGITASLLTSGRLLCSTLIVGLASKMYDATIYPIVGVILGIVLIVLPCVYFYERRQAALSPKLDRSSDHINI